jgi:Xaa-Pro aminopeptidase
MKRAFAAVATIILTVLATSTPPHAQPAGGAAERSAPLRLQVAERVPSPLPPSVFKARRERLMKQLGPGVAVLYGKGGDDDAGFKSDPNFYYLTGVDEEGAILVLAPGERVYREALFLKSVDSEAERWTGIRGLIGDSLRAALGFELVARAGALDGVLLRDLAHAPVLHMIAPAVAPGAPLPPESDLYSKLQARIPGLAVKNAQGAIAAMRQVKSDEELALMEKAIANTIAAQHAAALAIRPAAEENWVGGVIDLEYRRGGSVRAAFPSIVGSGLNSCVLHYPSHSHTIAAGSLVVVDIGAEYDHYAADITRTYPADGRWTPEQRAVYELVLKVQNACIDMVKPGVFYEDIHRHAEQMFREAGYRDDFIHGLGHWVGLDVHDAGDRGRALEPGMVLTIEPGVYLLAKRLGVRIEDDVLVTKSGHRLLTGALPRDPDAIERMMRAQ